MSQTAELSPQQGRIFTFEQVTPDVTVAEIGDIVEVTNFRTQFDPLVVSLVNATVSAEYAGSRVRSSREFYENPDCPRPVGRFAVQQTLGLAPNGRLHFAGWPRGMRLPSEVMQPKNQRSNVVGASVTILDRSVEELPLRSIDLLLQASLRSPNRGVQQVATQLSASKAGDNKLHASYAPLSEEEAADRVAAALSVRA